jgi:Predicted O-methyltransferase
MTVNTATPSLSRTATWRHAFDRTVKPVYTFLRDAAMGLIEWRYGIRTRDRIRIHALGLGGDNERKDHVPSNWTVLPRILKKEDVGPRDVFIDFGSGLGRIVFQAAARYPFQRVVGVELSPQLNEAARINMEKSRPRLLCKDVELITVDVLAYAIPDDVSVAYFGNPFTGRIFREVIERLLSSVDRRPRRLRLIYFNPVEHEYLMATGRMRLVRRLRGFRPTAEWSRSNAAYMYEVVPRA